MIRIQTISNFDLSPGDWALTKVFLGNRIQNSTVQNDRVLSHPISSIRFVHKNQSPGRQPLGTDRPTVLEKTNFEIPDKDFTTSSKLELEKIPEREFKTSIHRSPETFNQELPNPTPVSRSLKKMLESLPPSTDFKEDKKTDLDREPSVPTHRETSTEEQQDFDVTLDNSLSKAFPREEVVKPFYHQKITPVLQYKETSSSFASAIIDSLIILGLSSLFVVSLVAITKVDIINYADHSRIQHPCSFGTGASFHGYDSFLFYAGSWAFWFHLGRLGV